jgi:hypothetical protein
MLQTIVEVTLENIPVTFGIVPVDVREHGYLHKLTIKLKLVDVLCVLF